MIDAILSVSDPDEISAKRIRKALQELFAVDLDGDKKDIKALILERFDLLRDRQSKVLSQEELVQRDSEMAAALVRGDAGRAKRPRKRDADKPRKKRANQSDNPNSFHMRPVQLSEPLQRLLGEEQLPRTQVVKAVWDYIKQHQLQNPDDRREILCDAAMEPVFGKKMTMFSMNKILSQHLTNPKDVSGSDQDANTEEHSDQLSA
ncbi:ABL015Cp [Eremothecium gossypii ATCC 10895]|uniref:ABL015Cp n=1 Tax=Eremothecium gossypii (strain ATCC 10895 / CBS 109.51 / FGSC 9923 / NRRL Y-1056) TaxID=284811 RepID=Q75DN2_EREGS|nr:ABL015Cp [Eremothecium gossypii ATCC 10895]AAS50756.2 ABL015Cp [Eremothecium gossypii ATCC 10895]AEY95045.1 FABL015Cp [Eremothecium gossypii FDAG1]